MSCKLRWGLVGHLFRNKVNYKQSREPVKKGTLYNAGGG